ncbi:MAG: hypothetical protein M0D57_21570 [Sphingobacteriales bacterium JAD_PAG50586_3]|nr:MAG: hypothetical protein M0D57_21570 [Sphingobacteriales bacterium JAD_PAG50586_3]
MRSFLLNYKLIAFSAMVAIVLAFSACTKEEIIDGNQPPPDSTINNITKETYVNRLYISILGRECTPAEFTEAYDILVAGNLSVQSRGQVIDLITAKPGYYNRLFRIAEENYLNSSDSLDYQTQIFAYNIILQNQAQQQFWPYVTMELARINAWMDAVDDMQSGTITVKEMHKRAVQNFAYDGINMGSLNFVASLFQNFYYRYPTEAELDAGILCVDGFPSTVFFEIADSKEEYVDLFFASTNYYEGQVRDLFTRYLFREPTSAEQTYFGERYKNNDDYKQLQKDILSLDEYVGL